MFHMRRNQIIVTALAVMVAVAGYLNFTETRDSSGGKKTAMILNEEGDSVAVLDDFATLPDDEPEEVATMDPVTGEVAKESNGDGSAIFVSGTNDGASAFFAEAKLGREQSRAKQKDLLNDMMNNENMEKSQKDKCADNMLELQKRIEKETAAEEMIKAKGFKEAYVRMDDETVDVVVDKETLTDQELAQIEDIVKRKTGATQDKIRISPLQKAK